MELNKELISSIASVFGLTAEEMTAKITSDKPEELKLAGTLFTEDDLKKRDSGKYNEGKTAGTERLVKDLKQKHNYELDGVKDIDGFLTYHEEQLKTKYSKNSTERVTELEKDISKLKTTYEDEIKTYKSQVDDLSGKYKEQDNKNYLLSIMPKDTILKPEALITLFKSEYQLDIEEGKRVIKQNGEVVKDPKTVSPIEPSNIFNDWLVKEKYISAAPGRGGDNEFGKGSFNGVKSISKFQEQWQKENDSDTLNTPKYEADYAKWRAENKEVTA